MKFLKLLLLRAREASLENQVANGEVMLRETRALLIEKHRQLRQVRIRIAAATPASELLRDALRRRAAELGRRPAVPTGEQVGVASRLTRR